MSAVAAWRSSAARSRLFRIAVSDLGLSLCRRLDFGLRDLDRAVWMAADWGLGASLARLGAFARFTTFRPRVAIFLSPTKAQSIRALAYRHCLTGESRTHRAGLDSSIQTGDANISGEYHRCPPLRPAIRIDEPLLDCDLRRVHDGSPRSDNDERAVERGRQGDGDDLQAGIG